VTSIRLFSNISKTAGDAIEQQSLITMDVGQYNGLLSQRQLGFLFYMLCAI